MSAFFCKKSAFLDKNSTFTETNTVRSVLEIFCPDCSFCKKVTINENISLTNYASGIRLPDYSKLAINGENDHDVTFCWCDVIVKWFQRCFVSLKNLWQFHFKKDWPEIQKLKISSSAFWPISGDWGELEIPNLARMLWNVLNVIHVINNVMNVI